MADDAWKTPPDLDASVYQSGIGFFQLIRSLESEDRLFGRGNSPGREPARLGQSVRLTFATEDNAGFIPGDDMRPHRVETMTIGLLGPDGPMPLHLTRWVMDRMSNRWFAAGSQGITSDTTFIDFCNMLQHRPISLYYRAWADTRFEVQAERRDGGRMLQIFKVLSGVDVTLPTSELDPVKVKQAPVLANQVRSPERLLNFLSEAIGKKVHITEFIGLWIDIPARLQSRLGGRHCGLGTSAVAGRRSFQRSNCAELQIGPLPLDAYKSFLPGGKGLAMIKEAVTFTAGEETQFNLRLVVERSEIPEARLGHSQLSISSWLSPTRKTHASDVCLNGIVGAVEPEMEAVI